MRFFFILEYIWVFVILASTGTAVVAFFVVTNQTGDLNSGLFEDNGYGQYTWVALQKNVQQQRCREKNHASVLGHNKHGTV